MALNGATNDLRADCVPFLPALAIPEADRPTAPHHGFRDAVNHQAGSVALGSRRYKQAEPLKERGRPRGGSARQAVDRACQRWRVPLRYTLACPGGSADDRVIVLANLASIRDAARRKLAVIRL